MSTIPKLIFIVPYRDREFERNHFSIYMKYIMEDYIPDDYEIYYSHQTDNRMFNRGATKNIGFLVMKNKYPNDYKNITFVFNDIDIIPAVKNMFNYVTQQGIVKHFYGFTFALGGIVSINGADFEKCNGFPNNWGWGLEDNALNDRVLEQSLIINRDQFYHINSKNIIHIHDDPNRIINNKDPLSYIKKQFYDNLNTITNLDYTIVNYNYGEKEYSINKNSINQNEYIINIIQFKTLNDDTNNTYYKQNMALEPLLHANKHNYIIKRHVKPRWLLNSNFK